MLLLIRRASKRWLALTILLVCALSPLPALANPQAFASLVEVRVHVRSPSLLYPWRLDPVKIQEGSGSLISGSRILTAAHVIEDHVGIEVRRHGSTKWFEAQAEQVCDQADLALLTVKDPKFFEGAAVLELGAALGVQDRVDVLGFPVGGVGPAITTGIVSRIELGRYAHSREDLLRAQIDAAINHGASGGPVTAGGKLVGVALQVIQAQSAESVGYIAPVEIVRHFLDDVADGHVDGFPRSGIWWQPLHAEPHRKSLGLSEGDGGVLIVHMDDGADGSALRPGDVLLSVGGKPISYDGTIELDGIGRVPFDHAFAMKQSGEPISLERLRGTERVTAEVRAAYYEMLIPQRFPGSRPPYMIFAGLVFQPLTHRYLEAFEREGAPANLVARAAMPFRTGERREIIVVTNLLPARINSPFAWAEDEIVSTVNGRVVRDMEHLGRLFDEARGSYIDIVLENRGHVVFDISEARGEARRILAEHDAQRDRSTTVSALPASPVP